MLHYRWWARNYETSDSLVNIFPDWKNSKKSFADWVQDEIGENN